MKSKLNNIKLPLIHPNRKKQNDFLNVCEKAIEDNNEGILDKKECIQKIQLIRKLAINLQRKKYVVKTTLYNPMKTILKIKAKKIINKRRNLSQILSESEQFEQNEILKNTMLDNNRSLNIRKDNEEINDKKSNYKKIKIIKLNISKNGNINNVNINKEKSNNNINKRYSIFKKINEYLESNNIALFEFLQNNPFQKRPYQIQKGFEFLEAVKFNNYQYVFDALQASKDFLFVFDYFGQTCYHWAAKLGNIKMLKILLEYGKHHNQKDFKGRTPLYLAAMNNNKEICAFLIKNKANIHLKDNLGNSAVDATENKELKFYLREIITQPYNNPNYKQKIADFLRKREENIKEALRKKLY